MKQCKTIEHQQLILCNIDSKHANSYEAIWNISLNLNVGNS